MTLAVFPRQTVAEQHVSRCGEKSRGRKKLTRDHSLVGVGSGSAVADSLVRDGESTGLEHLTLVLDQNWSKISALRFDGRGSGETERGQRRTLNSLNRSSSGLGDSGTGNGMMSPPQEKEKWAEARTRLLP